jgi:hypothetical protein
MGLLTHRPARRARATILLLAACTVAAGTLHPARAVAADDPKNSLDATCRARMQTLGEIAADNLERIEWEVVAGGVRGTYIGYASSFTCRLGEPGRTPPTARLSYQEVVYEQSGDSVRAARAAAPKPLEIREITIILVYRDGQWR